MKRLHQVDLHELAFMQQFVAGELLEVTEHHAKQSQGLDFAERQRLFAAQDGCIAFWMLFRRIERTREAFGERDVRSLLSHMTSFCVETYSEAYFRTVGQPFSSISKPSSASLFASTFSIVRSCNCSARRRMALITSCNCSIWPASRSTSWRCALVRGPRSQRRNCSSNSHRSPCWVLTTLITLPTVHSSR